MSAITIEPPFPVFTDTDGNPLEDGYIYIGIENLNPETNPLQVYWDAALSIPAAQPLRTIGGYVSRNGSPGQLYADAVNYSILVKAKNGVLVWSSLSGTGISPNSNGITFIQAGTGAVATTVQTKLRESVSVKDFGAKGDGVTDDAPAIQLAITAAAGKRLFFPPGIYLVGTQLTGVSSIYIFGAGRDVTTLKASAVINSIIFFSNKSYVEIEGISFDGNNNTLSNIRSYASTIATSFRVKGCKFTGTKNDATLNYGCIEISQSGGRSKDVFISENLFDTCGTHGAIVAYADGVQFVKNTLKNIGQHGMEAVTCTDVIESHNIIDTCGTVGPGGSGLGVGSQVKNWEISHNIIRNCGGDAPITAEFTSNFGTIDSNIIEESRANAGISVAYGASASNPSPFDKIQQISITNNKVRAGGSAPANSIGINIYSSAIQGEGIHCTENTIVGFNVGVAAQYLLRSAIDDNIILGLTGAGSCMVKAVWVGYSSISGNKTDSTTLDHTIQLLDYAGNSCDRVSVLDNTTFLSGSGATKSLVYIEGNGNFNIRGNTTAGASHYAQTAAAPTLQAQGNYGGLTGIPFFFGGAGVLLNAQGNFNGLADFAVIGGIRMFGGTAVPSGGTYSYNDRIVNTNCTVGQPKSWVCTVAGSPGTWVSEGNL